MRAFVKHIPWPHSGLRQATGVPVFRKILVAVDGSTGNERILLFAQHLARVESAHLIVVHAYELPAIYEWTDGYDALRTRLELIAAEVVQDAQEGLGEAGTDSEAEVQAGDAAEVVLQAARVHEVDLIIIGNRAMEGRAGSVSGLGSVSGSVLRDSTCPVLVVP
jgi:nucleotide-binding universal stress UspA family protein